MVENVQYKTVSDAERVPTKGRDLRSTFDVPIGRALSTYAAVLQKDLRQQQAISQPAESTGWDH